MRAELEKLMEKAKKQTAQENEKRGYIVRDYAYTYPGGGWKCAITSPPEAAAEKSFPTKEEAVQWGEEQGVEPPGYLLVFSF
jgi:hypothetical protein